MAQKIERDSYGIRLDKSWRDVRFKDDEGVEFNLMDWQAKLQSELGRERISIKNLKAELEWRRREMERALDAMFKGEYQEDDAKAMGQTVEGICETNTRLVNAEADNIVLAKQILGEVKNLADTLGCDIP